MDSEMPRLLNMEHLDKIYMNWSEDGGAEVRRIHDVYIVFEIPQYGGNPNYHKTYQKNELQELIDTVMSWT